MQIPDTWVLCWWPDFILEQNFRTTHSMLVLYLWLCLYRVRAEGKDGAAVGQSLYDAFNHDLEKRIIATGVGLFWPSEHCPWNIGALCVFTLFLLASQLDWTWISVQSRGGKALSSVTFLEYSWRCCYQSGWRSLKRTFMVLWQHMMLQWNLMLLRMSSVEHFGGTCLTFCLLSSSNNDHMTDYVLTYLWRDFQDIEWNW